MNTHFDNIGGGGGGIGERGTEQSIFIHHKAKKAAYLIIYNNTHSPPMHIHPEAAHPSIHYWTKAGVFSKGLRREVKAPGFVSAALNLQRLEPQVGQGHASGRPQACELLLMKAAQAGKQHRVDVTSIHYNTSLSFSGQGASSAHLVPRWHV